MEKYRDDGIGLNLLSSLEREWTARLRSRLRPRPPRSGDDVLLMKDVVKGNSIVIAKLEKQPEEKL